VENYFPRQGHSPIIWGVAEEITIFLWSGLYPWKELAVTDAAACSAPELGRYI
jgi:hypothetical protein